MIYSGLRKGFAQAKPFKSDREKFLSENEIQQLLETVFQENNKYMRRDHALIYLGYRFGLRAGETVILNRNTFRDITRDTAHIRRLKRVERIPFVCANPGCKFKCRIAASKALHVFKCPQCSLEVLVGKPKGRENENNPPETIPPAIERGVIEYVQDYIQTQMRPDQEWLFEGHPEEHLSTTHVRNIFNFYLMKSGLKSIYSWHALRHGRGVLLWDRFHDLGLVKEMLGHKSIKSSEFYIHVSPQRSEEVRAALERGTENPFTRKESI